MRPASPLPWPLTGRNALNNYHFVDWSRLVENVLRDIAPSPVVENAPRSVEVVLRSQQEGQRLLLHLINFTGEMTRPIRRVVPLENVRVTLRTKGEVKRIHTLMRPRTLAPQKIGGEQVQFVLPRMEEYEVVVLEKQYKDSYVNDIGLQRLRPGRLCSFFWSAILAAESTVPSVARVDITPITRRG